MKIMWAFDPFQENKELVLVGKKFIKSIFKKDDVCALYVASHAENELNNAFNIDKEKRYSEYPRDLMMKALKKLNLPHVDACVIPKETLSLSSIVSAVVNYSVENKADLILIPSNAKKLLPRIIFGSFAESLIHQAKTDLLVFHQNTQFLFKDPKTILLAHDFSSKSEAGLLRAIVYAKKWKSKLIILHVEVPLMKSDLENYKKELGKKIEKTTKMLDGIEFEIKTFNDFELVEETILKVAKKEKADLIALTAHSNKLEIFMGGSTTRRILRSAKVPILVLKSK